MDWKECLPPGLEAVVGDFEVSETQITVNNSGDLIAMADPTRVGLCFSVVSGVGNSASTNPSASGGLGLELAAGRPAYPMMTFRDWGPLVCNAWYYSGGAPPLIITVFKVRWLPRQSGS